MLTFNEFGLLPPGTYQMTFDEIRESVLIQGDDFTRGEWNEKWRRRLLDNAELLVEMLWQEGIEEIYLDGSFCTDKKEIGDIDGFYRVPDPALIATGELFRRLNRHCPWRTWAIHPIQMYNRYRVELVPATKGIYSMVEENGRKVPFEEFFRRDKELKIEKGIIQIMKG